MAAEPTTQGEAAPKADAKSASGQSFHGKPTPAEKPVVLIPVDMIDPPVDRLRILKHHQADAIGASIVAHGQYDPITVARLPGSSRFVLVDGLHRWDGCKQHQVKLIEARITSSDKPSRLRQEVLTGLARASHDVFDRAAQVAALAAMARESAGKPVAGDLRRLNGRELQAAIDEAAVDLELSSKSLHWSEKAAEDFDIGPRQVRKYALISARFSPVNVELLRRKKLADQLGALISLTHLQPDQFERALDFIADSETPTIAEALAHVTDAAAPTPFNKKLNKFVSWADALNVRERKQLMAELTARYDLNGRPLWITAGGAGK